MKNNNTLQQKTTAVLTVSTFSINMCQQYQGVILIPKAFGKRNLLKYSNKVGLQSYSKQQITTTPLQHFTTQGFIYQ